MVLQRGVRFLGEPVDHVGGAGAVPAEQGRGAHGAHLVAVRRDPDLVRGIRHREVAPAANGEPGR